MSQCPLIEAELRARINITSIGVKKIEPPPQLRFCARVKSSSCTVPVSASTYARLFPAPARERLYSFAPTTLLLLPLMSDLFYFCYLGRPCMAALLTSSCAPLVESGAIEGSLPYHHSISIVIIVIIVIVVIRASSIITARVLLRSSLTVPNGGIIEILFTSPIGKPCS